MRAIQAKLLNSTRAFSKLAGTASFAVHRHATQSSKTIRPGHKKLSNGDFPNTTISLPWTSAHVPVHCCSWLQQHLDTTTIYLETSGVGANRSDCICHGIRDCFIACISCRHIACFLAVFRCLLTHCMHLLLKGFRVQSTSLSAGTRSCHDHVHLCQPYTLSGH